MVGIEICLSNDAKSVFPFLQQNEALTFDRLVERDNRLSFTRFFHLLLLRKLQKDTTELYLYDTPHPCIFY